MMGFRHLFGSHFESKKDRAEREKRLAKIRKARIQDWDSKISWEPHMVIRAKSYTTPSLFDVTPTTHQDPALSLKARECVPSPNGLWMYREFILPKWGRLHTFRGSEEGIVEFNGKVAIPMINQRRANDDWRDHPWMSYTPMEYLTTRAGLRKAKGRVVVAGLGMGHHLAEICKKRTVKEVVLVEISEELIEWVLPRVDTNDKLVEVVCGDAYDEMPKLTADTAIVDIFESYGNNAGKRLKLERTCPNINDFWAWGSAPISDDRGCW